MVCEALISRLKNKQDQVVAYKVTARYHKVPASTYIYNNPTYRNRGIFVI